MTDSTGVVILQTRAMATYFEIALWGRDEQYLRGVAQEALEEIHRIEGQLSIYRDDTDIYELNAVAAYRPITLDPRVFRLLEHAKRLSAETGGAFDITVAPLIRAWGFMGASGQMADPAAVEEALTRVGMNLVELDEENFTARYLREGVMIDLGAIGKGYALEQVAELIRDYEVPGGLIHGGTSSVAAVGSQPDGSAWQVAIQDPVDANSLLSVAGLRDASLSVSAIHGKFFTDADARYGHVIDPRTGQPVRNALLAAVVCPSATESDALSTALLIKGESFLDILAERRESSALAALPLEDGGMRVVIQGNAIQAPQE